MRLAAGGWAYGVCVGEVVGVQSVSTAGGRPLSCDLTARVQKQGVAYARAPARGAVARGDQAEAAGTVRGRGQCGGPSGPHPPTPQSS